MLKQRTTHAENEQQKLNNSANSLGLSAWMCLLFFC